MTGGTALTVTELLVSSAVVGVRLTAGEDREAAERRVSQWAAPAGQFELSSWWQGNVGLLALHDGPVDLSGAVCLGVPVTSSGPATGAQIAQALERPAVARNWTGAFLIAGWSAGNLRFVAPTDLTTVTPAG